MTIVLGLTLLIAAAVAAVAGIFGNTGSAHALTNAFTVFGHHMTGSTGALFLYGIVVGAVGMLGLGLLLTSARRGAVARHGLRRSRETAAVRRHREELAEQRNRARPARAQATPAAEQRDDLVRQRTGLTQERDDLVSRQGRPREQTAGTRLSPMPQDGGKATPDHGHRRSQLLLGHTSGRR